MMSTCLFFSGISYLGGLVSFCINRKHLLLMLLSMEFVVLGLFLGLYSYLSYYSFDFYFSMIFLTVSVCEGAMGLAILVSLMRTHGNDYFKSFSVLW
uniref:NADH-ubiquinone oxidoreductase chain 4L n=1 Tax=Euchirus longimanus TaxID=1968892 RepID=A0AAU6QDT3_9SCAR